MKPARFACLDAVVFSGLSLCARAVYTAVHIKCEQTGECEFDQQEFAESLHLPRRNVQRALAELRDAGHLIIRNMKTINRYLLPWAESLRQMRAGVQSETAASHTAPQTAPHSAPILAQSENHTAPNSAPPLAQSGRALNLKEENKRKESPPPPFKTELQPQNPALDGFDIEAHNRRAQALIAENEAAMRTWCHHCAGSGRFNPRFGDQSLCRVCNGTGKAAAVERPFRTAHAVA